MRTFGRRVSRRLLNLERLRSRRGSGVLRPVSEQEGGGTDRGDQDQEQADACASHSENPGKASSGWIMQVAVQGSYAALFAVYAWP